VRVSVPWWCRPVSSSDVRGSWGTTQAHLASSSSEWRWELDVSLPSCYAAVCPESVASLHSDTCRLIPLDLLTVFINWSTLRRVSSREDSSLSRFPLLLMHWNHHHFWHAPLRVRSAKHRCQFLESMIVSHVSCLIHNSRSCARQG